MNKLKVSPPLSVDNATCIYNVYTLPIGKFFIASDGGSITAIQFESCSKLRGTKTSSPLLDTAAKQLEEYFDGKCKEFTLPLNPEGTPFQKSVWEALQTIPYGQTMSYKQIAEQIGNPKASRAVGMANNKNPIMIIIPCHRVVGTDGSLVGYAAGLDIKKKLLDIERKN